MASASNVRPTTGDSEWFVRDRFGMFIHWGLYALPARHEWMKSREQMSEEQYERYFRCFEPDLYDPELWAQAASDAGMKYFVITTKHHDGFCLWDSKLTDYKAPNTRAGRDLLRPMVDAFRGRGLRTGFYHSLIDWHHPQYVIDSANHPRRGELANKDKADPNVGRDQMKYADYLHGQVRELLTQFGQVDLLWFDFSFVKAENRGDFSLGKGREAWRSDELYKMIRELQPKIMMNDRLDLPVEMNSWDMKTPEQVQPLGWVKVNGVPVVWEACQTFSGSWGYFRDEFTWRSTENLIHTLIDCVSKGGNLLLNVGPTGRGEFDARALDRLQGIGRWMKRHSRSIYDCTAAPEEFACPRDCRLTYNPDTRRLYVHLLAWPYRHLLLTGKAFREQVAYAQLLHDASEVGVETSPWFIDQIKRSGYDISDALMLTLPQTRPDETVPVVELFLK
ncbi:MAG: alpha-L-fucosidase [Phycisphaerales bacterium]